MSATPRALAALAALACALAVAAPASAAQRRPAGKRPPAAAAASPAEFDKIAADAKAAYDANRLDEALDLAKRGVAIRPAWDEGWWMIATAHYQRDEYSEATEAFTRTTKLRPKSGLAWLLLGFCEYKLGRYDDAADHIVTGNKLGLPQNDELQRVLMYHVGALNIYRGEFEAAQKRFDDLAYLGYKSDDLVVGLGLAILRVPRLPEQTRPGSKDFDMIRQAGYAEYQLAQNNIQDAQREYDRLVADYPTAPWVYYAYGNFKQVAREADAAMEAYKKEIANSPTNALARIRIAYLFMDRQQPADGLPYAEEAVRLYARNAEGHFVLGRLLFDTGDVDRAITELEASRDIQPAEPKVYYALARAYDKAGRKDDARKARDVFTELNKAIDERQRAPQVRGEGAAAPK